MTGRRERAIVGAWLNLCTSPFWTPLSWRALRALPERTSLLVRLITRIEDLLPVAEAALPTLLIFDIAAITTEQVLSLVHSNPVLALVGIDLEKGQAVTFSGKTCTLYTVEDLTRLINGVDGASTFSLAPSD